ncbi:MAG: hypothetical protein COC01_06020 [Bacteroidetes bacterium]|nr:MAG: hypothetical protein COC01_06020 [Bacteroidota bacterium]
MDLAIKEKIVDIKQQLIGFNTVAGVELVILEDGNFKFNIAEINVHNNLLKLNTHRTDIYLLDELKEIVSVNTPICLVINGRGIIHKKVAICEGINLVQLVFPNANENEFYVQQQNATDESVFVSLARKSLINGILDQFGCAGFEVVSLSLGPFCLIALAPLLNVNISDNDFRLSFANHYVQYKNGQIDDCLFKPKYESNKNWSIGNDYLPESVLTAYGAAFQFLFPKTERIVTKVDVVDEARGDWKYKKLFKVFGATSLGFFLVVLLINFLLFNSFNNQNQVLHDELSIHKQQILLLNKLENQVEQKKEFLKSSSWLKQSKVSYYADQIGLTVPKDIKLLKLDINPLQVSKNMRQKNFKFANDIIQVNGLCSESAYLNNWIKLLRELNWVEEVTIKNFEKQQTNNSKFDLQIKTK